MDSNIEVAHRLMKVLEDPETYRANLLNKGLFFYHDNYPSHIIQFDNFRKEKDHSNHINIFVEDGKFYIKSVFCKEKIVSKNVKDIEDLNDICQLVDRNQIFDIILWYQENNITPSCYKGFWWCENHIFPYNYKDDYGEYGYDDPMLI